MNLKGNTIQDRGAALKTHMKIIISTTRKKHYSSRHRDEQTHRKSHSSSKHNEARHLDKYRSSSGDEHRHKKTSGHHKRPETLDFSTEDEDNKRMSDNHGRKHHSLEKQADVDYSKWSSVSLPGPGDDKDILASDSKPSSEPAEIPNDLRAKIRAMLLETL